MNPVQPLKRPFHGNLGAPMSTTYIANRYVFPNVAAGASALFEMPHETTKGELQDIKVQSNSAAFDIYVYPFATCEKDTIAVIYEKKGINKVSIDRGVACIWVKYSQPEMQRETHLQDIDKSLYLEFVNHGLLDSGTIIVETVMQQME
jgi:hypothetical protein